MNDRTNQSKKSPTKWYADRMVQIAILGFAGTVIAAIIAILPEFISGPINTEATRTAVIWTATLKTPPTTTQVSVITTETISPENTITPEISPTNTPLTPPIDCLDRWQIISSKPELNETIPMGECVAASAPGLGISASRTGISFGANNFSEQGIFGISTPLPINATLTLDLTLRELSQGEFWMALSNTPFPENNMYILALQPKSGELRTYSDQTSSFSEKYRYRDLTLNTPYGSGPPFIYNLTITTTGNRVNPQIHFVELPQSIVNLPNYLFIGFRNYSSQGTMSFQVEINELIIDR